MENKFNYDRDMITFNFHVPVIEILELSKNILPAGDWSSIFFRHSPL